MMEVWKRCGCLFRNSNIGPQPQDGHRYANQWQKHFQ